MSWSENAELVTAIAKILARRSVDPQVKPGSVWSLISTSAQAKWRLEAAELLGEIESLVGAREEGNDLPEALLGHARELHERLGEWVEAHDSLTDSNDGRTSR